ncbi:MAG TPA: four helix bundle protein [Mariniflexile sp.]
MNNRTKSFFRFRDFPVYIKAREFRKKWRIIIKDKFPKDEKFKLGGQFDRALDSVMLNIAEGSERYSDKDFSRFLNNSIGSAAECVSCIDCSFDDGYISKDEREQGLEEAEEIVRQPKAFSSKVRREDNKK